MFFFNYFHHIIHQGIFKTDLINFFHRSRDDGCLSECLPCCCSVCIDQARYSSFIPPKYRMTTTRILVRSFDWIWPKMGFPAVPRVPRHHSPARQIYRTPDNMHNSDVGHHGILPEDSQLHFNILFRRYRKCKCNEFTAFFFIDAPGRRRDCLYVSSKSISAARYSLAKISFIYLRCMENNLVSVK